MSKERFHPWRRMRDLGDTWKLRWSADLPHDVYGYTDFATRTITMREGLSFEERRCTIAHEVEHVLRGPVSKCSEVHEEVAVNKRVSRLLLPSMRDVTDSLIWHRGNYERVSEDMWVDAWTLETRLGSLWRREHEYLMRRLSEVVLLSVDD